MIQMALMFPCHVPMPPLNWSEHLWLPEISPTNESFITTVFEHRTQANNNQELLRHLSDSVAAIRHHEVELEAEAARTQAAAAAAAQAAAEQAANEAAAAAAQAAVTANIPDMGAVLDSINVADMVIADVTIQRDNEAAADADADPFADADVPP